MGFPLESSDDEKSLPWNLAGLLGVPKLGTMAAFQKVFFLARKLLDLGLKMGYNMI